MSDNPKRSAPPPTIISEMFIEYYKRVFVPNTLSEADFDNMLEVYKTQPPTVFRVISTGREAEKVQKELSDFIADFKASGVKCETIDYIPNDIGVIHKMSLMKKALRTDEKFMIFHKWLKLHNELGHCHRQEFVSMIPPFFLDMHESMSCLDMCAAPGSKTAQIIEMLSGDGFVVANDNDIRRIHPMVHQLQRVGTSRSLVVSFDGQRLPEFGVQFDRVLADVPCTCDGTIRKNIKSAEKFKLSGPSVLHPVQRKILTRGLELTKVGGLCVYSTCSMNPLEDEAVINSVLLQTKDAVEIVDVSDKFPQLIRHKGLTYWPVFDSNKDGFVEYKNADDVPKDRIQFAHPTNFPQPQVEGLERCMHFFPQDQDSGGFFVAVLRKVKEFERITEIPEKKKPLKEAAYIPIMEATPDVMNHISETFGLTEDFPVDCVFVRNENSVKNITICAKPLADMMKTIGSVELRTVSLGAKIFTYKHFGKDKRLCAYPCLEGMNDVLKYVHKNIYYFSPVDMLKLLRVSPISIGFYRLSEETVKQFEGAGVNGAIIMIKDTHFAYGGMSFPKSCVVYIRKDVVPHEIEKLKQSFPELEEEEKKIIEEEQMYAEKEKARLKAEKEEIAGNNQTKEKQE